MTPGLVIDLATAADLATVLELVVAFRDHFGHTQPTTGDLREGIADLLDDAATELLVARDGSGAAVGYAQIRYRRSMWAPGMAAELEDLFIVRDGRGAGAGRALLDAVVGRCRARRCRTVCLTTNERNEVARSLYESSGFSGGKAFWGGARQVWLEKDLPAEEPQAVDLRPTRPSDLPFVLAHERRAENTPFIGQWTPEEHLAAIDDPRREHWIIEAGGVRLGYVIAYDLRSSGDGVYVKRIVTIDKSRGVGRAAMDAFCAHAFGDLGAPFVWLSVYPENGRAQRSYRAAGFGEFVPADDLRARLRAATGHAGTSLLMRRCRP